MVVLLLMVGLSACGPSGQSAAPVAAPAQEEPAPVDPAALDVPLEPEPAPAEEAVRVPWQAPVEPAPKARWPALLQAGAKALEAGRLETVADGETGALEAFHAVLLAKPDHAEALQGMDQALQMVVAQADEDLQAGRIAEAERAAQILQTLRPDDPGLAALRTTIELARRAAAATRQAQAHARAGRIWSPTGRNAVASYREALGLKSDFLPALDGLSHLESDRLAMALEAAQNGDYDLAQKRVQEARNIRPESGAIQDMDARIVELRQARAEVLLVQGNAAVDALDLKVAASRLDEARRVSLQSPGLDALAERIELARHYGRFQPRQVFRDAMAGGGEGPELVVVAHGAFVMGSADSEPQHQDNEAPPHTVTFERGYAMARTETTVAEFRKFVEATGYRTLASRRGRSTVYDEKGGAMVDHRGVDWRRDYAGAPAKPEWPVVHVAFEDASAYAAWLSAQTGQRYRLPSEAEFEHALRNGHSTRYPWGDAVPTTVLANLTGDGDRSRRKRRWSNAIAGYSDGYWGPAPVRSYPEEGFGGFDLYGNVSEWVQDCWHDSYRRAPVDGSAWVNAGCEERVLRGGSWASALDRARSAYRQSAAESTTHARVGFRVVREI